MASAVEQAIMKARLAEKKISELQAEIRKLEGEAKAHRVDLNAAERSRLHRVLNTPALPLVV